jgi:hypothetical protein
VSLHCEQGDVPLVGKMHVTMAELVSENGPFAAVYGSI